MKKLYVLLFAFFAVGATVGNAEDSSNSQFSQQGNNAQFDGEVEDAGLDDGGLDNATPTDDLNELNNSDDEDWLGAEDEFENQLNGKNDFNFNENGGVAEPKKAPKKVAKKAAKKPVLKPAESITSEINEPSQEVPDQELLEEADLPVEDFQDVGPAPEPVEVKTAADLMPPNEFAGAPPVPDTIRNLVSGEGPEEYSVEAGDTLFDICDQLIDEPAYWPKLWALNPEIKNPHFIYPDMKLAFYSGDDITPPYLQVVAEDDVVPIDKGTLDEDDLIQEPVVSVSELVEEDPVEVVGVNDITVDGDILEGFILAGKIYEGNEVKLTLPGFIYSSEIEPDGEVIRGRNGGVNSSKGDYVLVEEISGVEPGSTYTVLRYDGEITNAETGDDVGYRYSFVAHMKMESSLEDDVVLGQITKSNLGVKPGDIVVSYKSTERVIQSPASVGALGSASANIVSFGFAGQTTGGSGQVAFIDQGSGDGVSAGMYIQVFSTPGFYTPTMGEWDAPDSRKSAGFLRIIDTTDAASAGYIVKNTTELRLGDRAGKG